MAEALERGTTATADGIRKEQEAVLGALREGTEAMTVLEERALLRRIYASFTAADIRAISEGRGPFLERLPDGAARAKVTEALVRLHRDVRYPEPSPWRGQHDAIARSSGAVRGQGPERDRGLGAEIEL